MILNINTKENMELIKLMRISDILKIFVSINIIASLFTFIVFGFEIFLNIQFAFISSFFIVVGSFIGYKNNILKQSEVFSNASDRDIIDDIDDKFDLYGEINEHELSDEDIKQIIQEEKDKIKIKDSFVNTIKSFRATTSIYRISGYLVLIIGFFYLNNHNLLNAIAYLLGFLIVPLMALIVNLKYIKS